MRPGSCSGGEIVLVASCRSGSGREKVLMPTTGPVAAWHGRWPAICWSCQLWLSSSGYGRSNRSPQRTDLWRGHGKSRQSTEPLAWAEQVLPACWPLAQAEMREATGGWAGGSMVAAGSWADGSVAAIGSWWCGICRRLSRWWHGSRRRLNRWWCASHRRLNSNKLCGGQLDGRWGCWTDMAHPQGLI